MRIIEKMERSKLGRLGIPNLMKYIVAVNAAGLLLGIINPGFYYQYLSLDMSAVFHGQVWRIFTFLLCPSMSYGPGNSLINVFWFVIWAFVYYSIGSNLERMWGAFRFTLFYVCGVLWVIIVAAAFYLIMGASPVLGALIGAVTTLTYLNQTLFLAFALLFPDVQFLFYFVIPVKAKWMSLLYLGLTAYELFDALRGGGYYIAALIVVSLVNLGLFWFLARGQAISPKEAVKQKRRQAEFHHKVQSAQTGPRHRCAICGRTERDNPQLEFRYCSKCEGNFEYCSDHLFTHEHVHHD